MQIRPNQRGLLGSLVSTAIILILLTIRQPAALGSTQEQAVGMPTRPEPAGLPARGRPTHTPVQVPAVGYIELHITPALDLWTTVEWQDGQGDWHVVDGWRGYANPNGVVRWQVNSSDLGKGPFRWQVYQYEEGELWSTSTPFHLPNQLNERVTITVQIPAEFYQ